MKVTMFNLMPYPRLSDEVIASHDSYWVTMPNSHYDPKLGHDTYNKYLDQLELCDELVRVPSRIEDSLRCVDVDPSHVEENRIVMFFLKPLLDRRSDLTQLPRPPIR